MQNQAMMLINTLLLVMAIALMALPARSQGGQVAAATFDRYITGVSADSKLSEYRFER